MRMILVRIYISTYVVDGDWRWGSCTAPIYKLQRISRGTWPGKVGQERCCFSGPCRWIQSKVRRSRKNSAATHFPFFAYLYPRGWGQRQNCRVKLIPSQIPSSARGEVSYKNNWLPRNTRSLWTFQRVVEYRSNKKRDELGSSRERMGKGKEGDGGERRRNEVDWEEGRAVKEESADKKFYSLLESGIELIGRLNMVASVRAGNFVDWADIVNTSLILAVRWN